MRWTKTLTGWVAVAIALACLLCPRRSEAAVLFADVKADYLRGTNPGDTSGTVNPLDTFGTGRWDYYQTDTFGAGGTGSLTLLGWDGTQNPGSGPVGRYERAGVNHSGGNLYDFPMFADQGGFGQIGLGDEVFVHPSDTGNSGGGADTKVLLRWTAGAGEDGPATIAGRVRRPSPVGSGGQMKVFVDGTQMFDAGVLIGNATAFSFDTNVSVGSVVDFVFDPVSNSHNEDSMYLAASISAFASELLPALPRHRYSFSDDASDSIGTADLTLAGGAGVSGGKLVLPGGGVRVHNAQAQGPALNEIASTINSATAITMEGWFTQEAAQNWAKLMMTGTDTGQYMDITPRRGADGNVSSISINDIQHGENNVRATGFGALANGVEYYVASLWDTSTDEMTIHIGGVGGTLNTYVAPMGGQLLSDVGIDQFYLGSAVGFGDQDFNGQIDEFRIYDYALSGQQAFSNFRAGPDVLNVIPEPSTFTLAVLALLGLASLGRRARNAPAHFPVGTPRRRAVPKDCVQAA